MKFTRLHRLQKKKVPRTLKRSFLIITVALMIIFGIGAAVISYVIFSDSLRSNAIHSAETNLQFMRNDIDSNLDSVMELALWSRTNTSVINYISSDPEGSAFNALTREAGERLSEEYLSNSANPYISRIIITNSGNTKYLQRYLQASRGERGKRGRTYDAAAPAERIDSPVHLIPHRVGPLHVRCEEAGCGKREKQ